MFNYYNPQASIDRINNQIAELEKMKASLPPAQQPTNLTQNFQLAPSQNNMRYANNIEEVEKDIVISDTPYFSKDLSVLWLKNSKGNIKSFELKEIVQKDEKDLLIESLQMQMEELRKEVENAKSINNNDDESVKDEESSNVSKNKSNKK